MTAAAVKVPKPDLEITLERIVLPKRKAFRETTHQFEAALIWPRVGIARRAAQTEIRLRHGECDMSAAPWHERILFKESCEGRFALQLSLTVSLTRETLRKFRRLIAGYVLKSTGEVVDNTGYIGEIAEAPLKAASKELLGSFDPELLAQGAIDLDAAELSQGLPVTCEVPLYSAIALTKVYRRYREIPVVGTATVIIA